MPLLLSQLVESSSHDIVRLPTSIAFDFTKKEVFRCNDNELHKVTIFSGSKPRAETKRRTWPGDEFVTSRLTTHFLRIFCFLWTLPRCVTIHLIQMIGMISHKKRSQTKIPLNRLFPNGDLRQMVRSSQTCTNQKNALRKGSHTDTSFELWWFVDLWE